MAFSVWLNETDLSTLGLYVEDIPGWLASPSRRFEVSPITGRTGGALSRDPDYQPRPLSIVGSIDPAIRTVAQRRTFEDALKALAFRGLLQVTVDDDTNPPLRIDAVVEAVDLTPVAHWSITTLSRATLRCVAPDPLWSALQGSLAQFGTTPTAIPLGTAVSGGIIRLAAPSWSAAAVADPTITYYNAARAAVETLGFTGLTLSAGTDYLEIDLDRQTVVEWQSGVATDRISLLTSGDFFALDPEDGDYERAAWPALGVTATAGSVTGLLAYTKRYL